MQIPKEKLVKFEAKWSDDSPDYPACASCGKQIGSEEADEQADETYEPEIPLRVYRERGPKKLQELCFHIACARTEGLL